MSHVVALSLVDPPLVQDRISFIKKIRAAAGQELSLADANFFLQGNKELFPPLPLSEILEAIRPRLSDVVVKLRLSDGGQVLFCLQDEALSVVALKHRFSWEPYSAPTSLPKDRHDQIVDLLRQIALSLQSIEGHKGGPCGRAQDDSPGST